MWGAGKHTYTHTHTQVGKCVHRCEGYCTWMQGRLLCVLLLRSQQKEGRGLGLSFTRRGVEVVGCVLARAGWGVPCAVMQAQLAVSRSGRVQLCCQVVQSSRL